MCAGRLVPVVAAVNGVAAGAGANVALNCDLVIAAQSANFIQAFSKIGLIPDAGGSWLLPRLVGRARALGLATDDYQNDKTLEDGDLLYSGAMALPGDFWATHGQKIESWQQGQHTFYKIDGPIVPQMLINQFV